MRPSLQSIARLTAGAMLLQCFAPVASALQSPDPKSPKRTLPMTLPPEPRAPGKSRVVKPNPHLLKPLPPGTRVARAVPGPTLLDERAYLRREVSGTEAAGWRRELWSRPASAREARLRIQLGEYLLGSHEPEKAEGQLRRALAVVASSSADRGLASYDVALSLFLQGRFGEARHEFRRILLSPLRGFDRKNAALYVRHAGACAGYHAAHAALGITEPTHLDPLCGVASLTAAMQRLGLKPDRAMMLARVRHDGEGSSLQDLVDSLPSLGLTGRVVTADQKGLIGSPVPMVAFVERDHFVTVVDADRKGIEYVCSDCGPWPGGPVRLTWKQWKAMDASLLLAVAKAGSPQALALAHLPERIGGKAKRLDLASRGSQGVFAAAQAERALASMAGHVAVLQSGNPYGHTLPVFCGMRGTSLHCALQNCPMWSPASYCKVPHASFAGEPVNLATGEEEYAPAPDITVYNPKGPSIVWGRTYNSLGNTTPSGLGSGWSHSYNYRIVKKPSLTELILPNAARLTIHDAGVAAPTAANPTVALDKASGLGFDAGIPMKIDWLYSSPGQYKYAIKFGDGTKWTFDQYGSNSTLVYYPGTIQDRFGNPLYVYWGPNSINQPDPETGSTGAMLIDHFSNVDGVLARLSYVGNGQLAYISEYPSAAYNASAPTPSMFGRAIRYSVSSLPTHNVGSGYPQTQDELIQASVPKLVTRDASGNLSINPAYATERYNYGYSSLSNLEGSETIPCLTTISVPDVSARSASINYLWNGSAVSTTTLAYGSDGSVASVTDGNGNVTTFTPVGVDQFGNPAAGASVVSATGTTATTKDSANSVSRQVTAHFAAGDMRSTGDTYSVGAATFKLAALSYGDADDPRQPSSVTDGNNRTWTMDWDAYGNLLSTTSPKGVKSATSYGNSTFFGQPTDMLFGSTGGYIRETNPHYNATTGVMFSVDATAPYRSGLVPGAQQTTTFGAYTTLGNPTSVTEPNNVSASFRTTTMSYTDDPGFPAERLGLPTKVTDAAGHAETMKYDARGNLIQRIDRDGNQTDYQYETAGNQLIKVTLPATGEHGSSRARIRYYYAYDGGPVTLVQQFGETNASDSGGDPSVYVPDAQNLTNYGHEGEVYVNVGTSEYQMYFYDASYRVKEVRTGTPGNYNGTGTRYTYDVAGRVATVREPAASGTTGPFTTNYTYDAAGNVKTETDGRNRVKTYTYGDDPSYPDADGLLTHVAYTDATTGAALSGAYAGYGYDATYAYDAYDRLSSAYSGPEAGTVNYAYDNVDNVVTEHRDYGVAVDFAYQYNPDGSTLQMIATGTGATLGPWAYGWYYTYDSLGRFASLNSPMGISSATYSSGGRLLHRGLPNGVFTDYYYYQGSGAGSQSALANLYHYDKSGNVVDSIGSFSYSPLGALRQLSASNGPAPLFTGTTTFGYSTPTGNDALRLLSETSSRNGGYTNTHTYDTGLNPLTLRGVTQATGATPYRADGVPYATQTNYDNAGDYSASSFSHNAEHQLISGPSTGWTAGYRPDDGLRAWKTVGGVRTYKYYDQEGTPVLELGASGDPTAFMASDPEGLVGRCDVTTGARRLYQFDEQGSVALTTDGSGALVDERLYDAYGYEFARDPLGAYLSVPQSDEYGFDARWGYVCDRELGGYYYCQSRYYAPNLGRWLEQDPIGFAGGMNQYSYCAAQPVGNADASGLQAVSEGGGVMQSLIDSINSAAGLGTAGTGGIGLLGGAGMLARCGWGGLAAGVGYGIGWGINQIPAVQDSQRFYGNILGGDRDSLPAANVKGPSIHHDKREDEYRINALEHSAGHTPEECDEIYEAVLRKLNRLYNFGKGRLPRHDYARLRRELDAWYANCVKKK